MQHTLAELNLTSDVWPSCTWVVVFFWWVWAVFLALILCKFSISLVVSHSSWSSIIGYLFFFCCSQSWCPRLPFFLSNKYSSVSVMWGFGCKTGIRSSRKLSLCTKSWRTPQKKSWNCSSTYFGIIPLYFSIQIFYINLLLERLSRDAQKLHDFSAYFWITEQPFGFVTFNISSLFWLLNGCPVFMKAGICLSL